jgi:hypothetical protein
MGDNQQRGQGRKKYCVKKENSAVKRKLKYIFSNFDKESKIFLNDLGLFFSLRTYILNTL